MTRDDDPRSLEIACPAARGGQGMTQPPCLWCGKLRTMHPVVRFGALLLHKCQKCGLVTTERDEGGR